MCEEMKGCPSGNCSGTCHKWGHQYHLLKKLVMLCIMLVVFWFGTQLGELKALTRMQYNHKSMMENWDKDYGNYKMGMMNVQKENTTQALPAKK